AGGGRLGYGLPRGKWSRGDRVRRATTERIFAVHPGLHDDGVLLLLSARGVGQARARTRGRIDREKTIESLGPSLRGGPLFVDPSATPPTEPSDDEHRRAPDPTNVSAALEPTSLEVADHTRRIRRNQPMSTRSRGSTRAPSERPARARGRARLPRHAAALLLPALLALAGLHAPLEAQQAGR